VEVSTGFVLLRHETATPLGQKIEFWSLSMHLLPWQAYRDDPTLEPPVFLRKKRPEKVKTNAWGKGLRIAAVTGFLVGCALEARTESALVGISVPVVYLALSGPWRRKVALVAVFLSSFIATGQIWRVTFERALRSAQTFVARAGGHPFPGRWTLHHPIWHAIYTGLEDFSHGTKGYVGWDDRDAFRYAAPLLRERYGLDFTYPDGDYYFLETYDPESRYRVSPLDLPEYGAILREKIVRDIWEDPLWYLSGLGERSGKILRDTTPLSLAVGGWHAAVPLSGWIVVPTVLVALILRRRVLLSVVVLTLPLSLIALLVVSDFGTTHYSIFHLVSVAVWGQLLFEGATAIRHNAWKTTISRQVVRPQTECRG